MASESNRSAETNGAAETSMTAKSNRTAETSMTAESVSDDWTSVDEGFVDNGSCVEEGLVDNGSCVEDGFLENWLMVEDRGRLHKDHWLRSETSALALTLTLEFSESGASQGNDDGQKEGVCELWKESFITK